MLGIAFAMAAPPGGAQAGGAMGAFQAILPLVFMFAIFYFLLIRPQQKKAKEHRALLDSLKRGDQVVTAGGMHGKVSGIDGDIVNLEIAPGVVIKITKGYVASLKKD
ncbi:preprotein translocase subunit YajC [Geobacter sulfurreducens]|jgi:preprotein translocase subunit YajC|uniref:Sec translocon accessory complex subunit YajC n=1 Tax=Geobacter sulfurreducens (strain ATCC 51573 / DSM 12127 / PCA) TaxID=243231 RepID=Q749X4_GEOSL|nr:preprotein translocase subunit YajC [Geobacter sulfurreducens]AAR35990.1 preprotein translocase, YajC subunit [Geobacter sulfurreducens PCA]ADI85369.1 preprotein translocase, YajC subunit [Geobacter sulfurreducens KN400]AJY68916.1 preprotein translocase subunit YajC [Geobacter sulfurreducens]QVW34441.1 preprotein translocase subunit YajC [Geobacter sulfurreducens]UAC03317.1 preprotein translocase subunit YajC [Geobacter sulfurreducens]